jgi:hypothetical protein
VRLLICGYKVQKRGGRNNTTVKNRIMSKEKIV